MRCLACKGDDVRVVKTYDDGVEVKRTRVCPCGARWSATESSDRQTLVAPGQQKTHVATNGQQAPPMASNSPSLPSGGAEGVGGGLPSGSDPAPDPGPGSPGDPNRARARRRPAASSAPVEYPEPFIEVWRETGQHGKKHKAFEAWVKMGRWPWRQLRGPYEAYLKSETPAKLGAIEHLATWLNGRGHQQEWPAWSPPAARADQERQQARERTRLEIDRAVAAADRQVAALRQARDRAHAPTPGHANGAGVDIRSHVADLATQKSLDTEDAVPTTARSR